MKSTGIVRKVDELGRIVLPIELRRTLNIAEKDSLGYNIENFCRIKEDAPMTHRERANAVLHYENYDKLPVVHFGFWAETKEKWYHEGHLTLEEAQTPNDRIPSLDVVGRKLGFDFGWGVALGGNSNLFPAFEDKILRTDPDGTEYYYNSDGVVVMHKPGSTGIPAEVEHTLVDRTSYEQHYKHRLQFAPDRLPKFTPEEVAAYNNRDYPLGLHLGVFTAISATGLVVGTSYLMADDEELYAEIIDTVGALALKCTEEMLKSGIRFDYGHFWEDICFKNGPLVIPAVFDELVGPWYNKITQRVREAGIDSVSLDCDGMIDKLIPVWLENGVNTMFPIEVGTWNASIAPWREKYGRQLRGVGGMNKTVFSRDKAAVEAEVERLKRLIDLGGFIPCPDHRIAPDAKFELVQYYCELMRKL